MTDALAAAPVDDTDSEDTERREKLRRAVARLATMGDAIATAGGQPRTASPRLALPGDGVLVLRPVEVEAAEAWAVAWFDSAWARQTLIERPLAELGVATRDVVWVRDDRGETLTGAPLTPEAQTTEASLAPWGLPWTISVGFADLADLRARATRRHALLTGSIGLLVVLIALGAGLAWRTIHREMELSKLKSDFVDNVSHELRTPVTSIKMFSELLSAGTITDRERTLEYYRLLASESNRLARIVGNMLNFSRIVAGRMSVVPKPTDMETYLSDLQRELQIQAAPTGHRVRLHRGTKLPPCVIDRDSITQAVANLVSNAIKYSPDAPEIILTAQRRDGMLSLMVRDRGVGIPDADLPHVFDRFYRVKRPGGEDVQGTGLGLTIVKDAVERHGGTIRVESRVDEGTVVELLIPIESEAGRSWNAS